MLSNSTGIGVSSCDLNKVGLYNELTIFYVCISAYYNYQKFISFFEVIDALCFLSFLDNRVSQLLVRKINWRKLAH